MKNLKIFNILLALILMISACDSTYDDIYDEIDKDNAAKDSVDLHYSDKTESPETYTMLEDDYSALKAILEDMGTAYEDAANSLGYGSFSDDAPADEYLPYLLDVKFFSYTAGTEMIVTYKNYTGSSYEDVADLDEWELESANYAMFAALEGDDYFTSSTPADDYIPLILEANYPLAEAGTEMFVKYIYKGSHYETYTELEFNGTTWVFTGATSGLDVDNAYELEDADYEDMGSGPGEYHSFSDYNLPEDYLPDWMLTEYPSAVTGDKQVIIYYWYGEGDRYAGFTKSEAGNWTKTHSVEYNWDSGDFNVKTLSVTADAQALFKFTTDEGWLFVPPLKFVETTAAATRTYELQDADYELVGDGKYKNFTIADGGIIEKISTILKANFNDLAVGDIFEVTYKGYDGGVDTYTINLEVQLDV